MITYDGGGDIKYLKPVFVALLRLQDCLRLRNYICAEIKFSCDNNRVFR